jgi:ubiquinone/menaquinone biosynthesis C-methylase UbiE
MDNWNDNNSSYWDNISLKYDTTYQDEWSREENEYVANLIKPFCKEANNIIDLGCGTGLGYSICKKINPNIKYLGIDISQKMLDQLLKNYPKVNILQANIAERIDVKSKSKDLAICIFTAFSYSNKPENSLTEIHRILKPNGKIFISVLSRYSLRRLIGLKFSKQEKYKSRNIDSKAFSYSNLFSSSDLKKMLKEHYRDITIIGYNPFGGIPILTKTKHLWKLNLIIGSILSFLSHELIVTATKK